MVRNLLIHKKTNRIHPLNVLLNELNIKHQLIRPRTPRHNGKVELIYRMIRIDFIII